MARLILGPGSDEIGPGTAVELLGEDEFPEVVEFAWGRDIVLSWGQVSILLDVEEVGVILEMTIETVNSRLERSTPLDLNRAEGESE